MKEAIEGNLFDYKFKNYISEEGHIYIELAFGDWGTEDEGK